MASEENKISIKDLRVEIIEERHSDIIKHFNVDEKNAEEVELKDFLIEDALKNQLMGISTTYLWFYNPRNALIGYITVLTDAVRIHGTRFYRPFCDQGVPYKTLPAVKIGRMCVDNRYKGKGIGSFMLPFVMRLLIEINEKMGCRFLIVDAKREAVHFYKKFGFDVLKERKKGTLPMFFDMIKIIQYFREHRTKIEVNRIKEK